MDPLVVARKIATTDSNKFLTIGDIEDELRDGERGINRSRWNGKEENTRTFELGGLLSS